MEHILVPTDFSNGSYNALFHAVQLNQGKTCTIYLLNTFEESTPLQSNSPGKDLWEQLKDESLEGLQSVSHKLRLDFPDTGILIKMVSKKGPLTDVVRKIINEKNIDLVVIGNSGRSELEAILLGSNALDIMEAVEECPLLIVPKEIDFTPPKEIAFATDYENECPTKLLYLVLSIVERYTSNIHIMHIDEEKKLQPHQEKNKKALLEQLSTTTNTIVKIPKFKTKATAIHTFLEKFKIDMLVMVYYKHRLLKKITREPVLKRIAFNLDIPFLIMPYKD